jgi:hypothetical protein
VEQSFALVSNTAREGRIWMALLVWMVLLPVMGLVFWRIRIVFGHTAAAVAGAVVGVVAIGLLVFWYTHRERYTLTITPSSIAIIDARGNTIESLARADTEVVLAAHQYAGRVPMRLPVLVLRARGREITVGANTWADSAIQTDVPAARFLVDPGELPRLKAAVESPRAPRR